MPELITHDTERRLCAAAGDTASRFAEVLSFSRLGLRVAEHAGCALEECLDSGGRVVAMAAAARMLTSKLKAYASVETKPEFLTELVNAVDEFKRCCITAGDLMDASLAAEGSLAQKLEELSLLLEAYDGLCANGKKDPRDRMSWVLEKMEETDYGADSVVYVDGFPDFTRQHMAILAHLIRVCPHVTVSLNCDRPGSNALAFEKAGQTALELLRIAEEAEVPVETKTVQGEDTPLQQMCQRLFQGPTAQLPGLGPHLTLLRCATPWQECTAAAEQIRRIVQAGGRYRQISVVCPNLAAYRPLVSMVFHRCRIPVYLSGSEDILEKAVICTVLSAIDAAADLDQREVLRYLRSVLSPLDADTCDLVENYAVVWNIQGTAWARDWSFHPRGLNEEWTPEDTGTLAWINEARSTAMAPILHLREAFRAARHLSEQVEAVYTFLEEIQLSQRLGVLADQLDEAGDNRSAQELNQLWEILLSALEQMYAVLGDTVWETDSFSRLFRLLLSQYDVGTIPTVLDSVTVGPVNAMRCQQQEYLIVLGATEGTLPGYAGSAGLLSDQERVALRKLGVPLTGGAMEGIQEEFAEIYGVFCGAGSSVLLTCPEGQPSMVYRRLLELRGEEQKAGSMLGAALADPVEAGAYLAARTDRQSAESLGLAREYHEVKKRTNYTLDRVQPRQIQSLYGKKLRLSASQVDQVAACRLSYFLRYGLRARERKQAQVDPAEFGKYVHTVLEQTAREIREAGGFHAVTLEQTMEIAARYARIYADEKFSQLESQRVQYLFARNNTELGMVVQELWTEMQGSYFEPVGFEVKFDEDAVMPPIPIEGAAMPAIVRGFVDRVDRWDGAFGNFFRVVDYKTGQKSFDYCDVYNGVGLQMLLYLFALEESGSLMLGQKPIPAGVLYFPARVPIISVSGRDSKDEAEKERSKKWKRSGLLLDDEAVLQAMEPGDKPERLSYTVGKHGDRKGDLASRDQLQQLERYLKLLLKKIVNEIASGDVSPNPYTRGSKYNACTFCPYGAVCHQAEVEGRRNYASMKPDQFWEQISREVEENG